MSVETPLWLYGGLFQELRWKWNLTFTSASGEPGLIGGLFFKTPDFTSDFMLCSDLIIWSEVKEMLRDCSRFQSNDKGYSTTKYAELSVVDLKLQNR